VTEFLADDINVCVVGVRMGAEAVWDFPGVENCLSFTQHMNEHEGAVQNVWLTWYLARFKDVQDVLVARSCSSEVSNLVEGKTLANATKNLVDLSSR